MVAPTVRTLCFALLAWLILNITVPLSGMDPRLMSIIILLPQAAIVILIVLALRNRAEPSSHPANLKETGHAGAEQRQNGRSG
jgi:hypothetical protein